jgi:TolA-binding protein
VYPDERVASFIQENFSPIRVHIKRNPEGFKRFGAQWTPTVIVADADGAERYRFEGFLPAEDYLTQLEFGLAKVDFTAERYGEAERRFRAIVERYPNTSIAAEALYWAGVSKYKGSGSPAALRETYQAFQSRYRESEWAKKASVWAA